MTSAFCFYWQLLLLDIKSSFCPWPPLHQYQNCSYQSQQGLLCLDWRAALLPPLWKTALLWPPGLLLPPLLPPLRLSSFGPSASWTPFLLYLYPLPWWLHLMALNTTNMQITPKFMPPAHILWSGEKHIQWPTYCLYLSNKTSPSDYVPNRLLISPLDLLLSKPSSSQLG